MFKPPGFETRDPGAVCAQPQVALCVFEQGVDRVVLVVRVVIDLNPAAPDPAQRAVPESDPDAPIPSA